MVKPALNGTTKGDLNNLVRTISYSREVAVHMRTGLKKLDVVVFASQQLKHEVSEICQIVKLLIRLKCLELDQFYLWSRTEFICTEQKQTTGLSASE